MKKNKRHYHKPKLSIVEIRMLFLLIDNKYIVSNAALDVGNSRSVISYVLTGLMKKLPSDFFIYYTKEENAKTRIKSINTAKYNKFYEQGLILNEAYENICEELLEREDEN